MNADAVTYAVDGAVATITVDDGRANALHPDLTAAINAALDRVEADDAVKVVVLAGREGRFSGGFDLSVFESDGLEAAGAMVDAGGHLVRRLYGFSRPVVGACTGHAVAAGALLLLGCDVRVGPDAPVKIGLNEVAIGMVLPGWAFAIAEDRLSFAHRQRAVVNAMLFDGRGAVDAGFLDRVVDPGAVLAEAQADAAALANLDPKAYAGTVKAFRGSTLDAMAADLDRS